MRKFLLIAFMLTTALCRSEDLRIIGIDNFDEPVGEERTTLMRSEGLTVPPILLDRNGQRRKEIKFTDNTGRQIDVVFEPYGVSELPLKKKQVCEIIDDAVSKTVATVKKVSTEIRAAKISVSEKISKGSVKEIIETDFYDKVEKSKGRVCVVFGATWCGACERYHPNIEATSKQIDDVEFFFCDIDKCPNVARKYQVDSIPLTAMFEGGVVTRRNVGEIGLEQMKDFVRRNGITDAPPVSRPAASPSTVEPELVQARIIQEETEYRVTTFRHANRSPRGN